jgi:phosphoglycolate phosphatase
VVTNTGSLGMGISNAKGFVLADRLAGRRGEVFVGAGMSGATRVLFWDIDGTLLTTKRAGVFALEEAAREVCGSSPDFAALKTSGLTDHEVAVLAIRECGGEDTPQTASAFLRSYERHLPERLGLRKGGALPGVVEILDDLDDRPDVVSLLLTGNTAAGAKAKLEHYGLARYFAGGAFCVDGDDRPGIARRALVIAAEHVGVSPDPHSTFVIGDTPHDVRCGNEIGARTVAVATGTYSAAELAAEDPWLTLETLPGPTRFRELLGLEG